MKLKKALFPILIIVMNFAQGQNKFSRADTLRGSITAERKWWDLNYYELKVKVVPVDSSISGSNKIYYKVLSPPLQVLQIDLQEPMQITKIEQDTETLRFRRDGNAIFVELSKNQIVGNNESILIHYFGKPKVAIRPPWDGGFTWKRANNNWFIATSCQGLGASVWWPCKDHAYDEPDSMLIAITPPKNLLDVSNGQLRQTVLNPDSTKTYEWFVKNPINNYGVNINIGNYVHFSDVYIGERGKLDLNFYVLPENLEKAKVQFKQATMMLKAFEHWFGPYPFYEDGYKLVEVPYLGMEHQSSVTYGNQYKNGYLGRDLSGTGWGLKWDFIIIHESGHEWFANNITYRDIADMWIHESFTNYSESLFTEYYYGKAAGASYVRGTRKNIKNDIPIIGTYNVNNEGSGDMYYKGGNMLHTIRQIVNDDEKWRNVLRGLNKTFYHQTVSTTQVEKHLSAETGINLSKVFDQYLRTTQIPTLEYKVLANKIKYRWTTSVPKFDMPLKVVINKKMSFIYPKTTWQSIAGSDIQVDENFYIITKHKSRLN